MKNKITFDGDWATCECGNEPHLDGFYPCTAEGVWCEPTEGWEYHYWCARCDAVAQDTVAMEGDPNAGS